MEQYGRSLPPIRRWFEIRAGLRTAVEQAVYGEKTPEEALKDYNRELNELLREQ
jgi:ABC-type glycerol-3-phosphate transport system substrate-binding protein